jgi:hypothetical protein
MIAMLSVIISVCKEYARLSSIILKCNGYYKCMQGICQTISDQTSGTHLGPAIRVRCLFKKNATTQGFK